VPQRIVIELDQLRLNADTVHDARRLAGVAQAAARTRTLQIAFESDDFHGFSLFITLPATRQ